MMFQQSGRNFGSEAFFEFSPLGPPARENL